MKNLTFALMTAVAFNTFAQGDEYGYIGYDNKTGEYYRSKTLVDSCPRAENPECPRKYVDFYSEFVDIIAKKDGLKNVIMQTAYITVGINKDTAKNDVGILLSAQAVFHGLNHRAKIENRNLTKDQLIQEALKVESISSGITFNAIVRLIDAYDKVKAAFNVLKIK